MARPRGTAAISCRGHQVCQARECGGAGQTPLPLRPGTGRFLISRRAQVSVLRNDKVQACRRACLLKNPCCVEWWVEWPEQERQWQAVRRVVRVRLIVRQRVCRGHGIAALPRRLRCQVSEIFRGVLGHLIFSGCMPLFLHVERNVKTIFFTYVYACMRMRLVGICVCRIAARMHGPWPRSESFGSGLKGIFAPSSRRRLLSVSSCGPLCMWDSRGLACMPREQPQRSVKCSPDTNTQ